MFKNKTFKNELEKWLTNLRYNPRGYDTESIKYGFHIERHGIKLRVFNPLDSDLLIVDALFLLNEDNENVISDDIRQTMDRFLIDNLSTLFVDVFILDNGSIMVYDNLFPDEFNYNSLFQVLRKVARVGLYLQKNMMMVMKQSERNISVDSRFEKSLQYFT